MITDYAWDFGDSAGTTSTVQSVTFFYPPDTATYQVNLTVTTNHGCSDVYGYPVHVGKPGAVSVGSLAQEGLVIYPNPTANILNLDAATPISNVEIVNVLGQVLVSKSSNSTISNIDVSALSIGNYFIKVTSENNTKVLQFLKN